MRSLVVIPARFQSSRFPGKPLADLGGSPLIEHVWKRCCQAVGASEVIVATDDDRIAAVARDFGAVHHLRESIAFYCRPLLSVLSPCNILGVVCQETLAADCSRLLGVDIAGVRERSNESKRRIDQDLDAAALNNLKRFLVEDYQCLAALWGFGALSDQQFWRVMTSSVEGDA